MKGRKADQSCAEVEALAEQLASAVDRLNALEARLDAELAKVKGVIASSIGVSVDG